jgi:hypothetical protein
MREAQKKKLSLPSLQPSNAQCFFVSRFTLEPWARARGAKRKKFFFNLYRPCNHRMRSVFLFRALP